MTRKHFVRMAADIREELDRAENDDQRVGVALLARRLCNTCACFNENFDRERFLTACGL